MIDKDAAEMLRIIGLAGLAACVLMCAFRLKRPGKPLISWLGITAAGLFLLLYLLGTLVDADPAGRRLLPAGWGL